MKANESPKAKFGFSSMLIDNLFTVFNCKIIVDNPTMPPSFQHQGIVVKHHIVEKTTKKLGTRHISRYTIRYCTMSYDDKVAMQQEIGVYLRNNAIYKIHQKWHWLGDPTATLARVIDQAGDALPADWAMSLKDDDNPYAMQG